ncbi:acyltransferase family protein [Micropruina sp.]|uniref:acyltransferase family protein n=1 Tax=Micropruina sp. TaxID=2737536 RepID=UPI0026279E08|nr:acyltransferase family protein [Micropruina sp.]
MTNTASRRPLRQDIQGLRFVAVLLVVVYHVWLDRVSGGVDIFLVLSAFFLTSSFARKLDDGRPLALAGYWTRTFARIVPLATLTILAVVATAQWLMPIAVWPDIQQQAIASALYMQNWWLAANDVNYYGGAPIPLQHFWSLSIQGTVFLAWPLIFAVVALVVRWRPDVPVRRLLAGAFGLIFVASLAWSVWITAVDQTFAYFDTRARLWEFAFGSLLALVATGGRSLGRPGSTWRTAAGWLGLATILLVGVVVNVRNAFPGWIALIPLTAAATIVLVGDDPGRWSVGRLLGHRWIAGLGNASYALYLVHWPILIVYVVTLDADRPSLLAGGVIIVGSVLLAIALHRWVELPLRNRTSHWGPWRDGLLVVVAIALVLGAVTGWRQLLTYQAERDRAEQQAQAEQARLHAIAEHPGARVLDPAFRSQSQPTEPPIPTIADIPYQWGLAGPACPTSWRLPTKAQQQCQVLTDPGLDDAGAGGAGAASASALPLQAAEGVTRVLLVGNSHMQHWSTAIREIGRQEGWQVLLIYEQNCYLAPAGDPINEVEKCADFWPDVLDSIEPLDPDLVITVATKSEDDGETTLTSGLELLEEHVKPERTVIAMRDTPRFEVGLTQCEANRQPDDPPCESGHPILDTPNPLIPLVKSVKGLNTMELSDLVCPERLCVSTIGNVRVWMDQHHLTRDYVETTTDLVRARLMQAIERA